MIRDLLFTKRLMGRKMALNRRAMIVALSLAAIPLTAILIAVATDRGKRKSLQTSRLLRQTRAKVGIVTTTATTAVHKQEQKEKPQVQPQPSSQGSEKKAATTTAMVTTNTTIADKDITAPPEVLPSIEPSGTSDSSVMSSSSQTSKEEEISVSDEARKARESLKELIVTAIKEAKDSAKGTGKRIKEQTINIAATADSKNIHSLGDNVNALVGLFEETMTEIRKERYDEQIKLLDGYKHLLQTHIKIVNARGRMASKLYHTIISRIIDLLAKNCV